MADEFEINENPDNVPGAVSTSYQRQNTNSEIDRNGVDLSNVVEKVATNQVTVNISGGVDVNGVMYSCKTSVDLIGIPNGTRYIKLIAGSTTDFLTPSITANIGTFDTTKNARYDSGDRVLGWAIVTTAAISRVYDLSDFDVFIPGGIITADEISTDIINERTGGAGVTADGVQLKDSLVYAKHLVHDDFVTIGTVTANTIYDQLTGPDSVQTLINQAYFLLGGGKLTSSGNVVTFAGFKLVSGGANARLFGYDVTAKLTWNLLATDGDATILFDNLTMFW